MAVQQDASSSSSTAPQTADMSMSGNVRHEQNSQKPEGEEASVSEAAHVAEASPSEENHGAAQVAESSADMIVEGIADICFLLP